MNDTKTYLRNLRATLAHRLAGRFLAGLILFSLSCAAAFAWVRIAGVDGVFAAVRPTGRLALLRALIPSAAGMLAVYLSAYTIFPGAVSAAVIAWRGLCLGCAGGLMKSGAAVSLAPTWGTALTLYFAASVCVMLAASVARVYSLALCRTYADGTGTTRRGMAREFLRLWLMLSGAVFLLGGAAAALV